MEKKIIKNARSDGRGITIFSNILPEVGVRTYYNADDNIVARIQHIEDIQEDIQEEEFNKQYNSKKLIRIGEHLFKKKYIYEIFACKTFKYILMMFFWILALLGGDIAILGVLIYLIFSNMLESLIFFINVAEEYKSKNGTKFNIAKFHSAEHKSINAYEKYKRIPTISEVKKASPFTKYCGSSYYYMPLVYKVINIILIPIVFKILKKMGELVNSDYKNIDLIERGILIFIVELSIIALFFCIQEIVKIVEKMYKFSLFNFMQYFFTNKPDEREIILSIIAIENYEIFEAFILKVLKNQELSGKDFFKKDVMKMETKLELIEIISRFQNTEYNKIRVEKIKKY